ncbi:MAG: DUF4340 domain-containing protein [Planctomycetes bacterium]|nr:DUF4340 domain-containing protein [Planctomycetota bacterium]
MSEQIKTIIYIVVAGVSLVVAWVARPASPSRDPFDDAGQAFFEDFTDPLDAASLQIVEFDEDTASPRAFKVARHDGVWSIPSHENYAADAENQFADAATSMIGLIRGSNVSDSPSDHELYGVIDPTQAEPGAVGVGMRVTLESETGRTLADLIIGKPVKGQDDQRYVREPGRVRVYLCAIETEPFSTRFEDWIERDLLQLNANDIAQVVVNDYSIDEINQRIIQGERLRFSYDQGEREWRLDDLGENEQLLDTKRNAMKRALDDLEIIDVHRKPAGLGAELREEDQLELDMQSARSLESRGYYIIEGRLLSNKGVTTVRMNDGVQYVLRFGEIALGSVAPDDEEDGAEGTSGGGGANRYLFVTANFNADLIEQPNIEVLPEFRELIPPPADDTTEDDELPGAEESAEAQESEARIAAAVEDIRREIEQNNQQAQEAYDQKVQDGQQRVRELNDRFADWYYVISDAVYQKIRLQRSDIVETTEPEAIEDAVDSSDDPGNADGDALDDDNGAGD